MYVALAEGDVVAAREHLAHLGAMAVRWLAAAQSGAAMIAAAQSLSLVGLIVVAAAAAGIPRRSHGPGWSPWAPVTASPWTRPSHLARILRGFDDLAKAGIDPWQHAEPGLRISCVCRWSSCGGRPPGAGVGSGSLTRSRSSWPSRAGR